MINHIGQKDVSLRIYCNLESQLKLLGSLLLSERKEFTPHNGTVLFHLKPIFKYVFNKWID